MKCCICKGEIEKLVDGKGEVVWETGNNAEPFKNGRCCDTCNTEKVIPLRISNYHQHKK